MNPIDVFLFAHSPLNDGSGRQMDTEIIDGNLYLIEFDDFKRISSKTLASSYRGRYMRQYGEITRCFAKRDSDPKKRFICQCGACSTYMVNKLYNLLYNTPSISETVSAAPSSTRTSCEPAISVKVSNSIPTSPKSSILEETLDEIFDEEETTTATAAPSKPSTNPLDGAVVTFGKYKGRSFKDVFESDKGYCMWCIENSAIKQFVEPHKKPLQNMVLFVSYVKQKFTE